MKKALVPSFKDSTLLADGRRAPRQYDICEELDMQELHAALADMEFQMEGDELASLLKELDTDKSGDFDLDGSVTVADMLQLLSEFECAQSCASDLNGDGVVSVADLLALLGLFGTPCV